MTSVLTRHCLNDVTSQLKCLLRNQQAAILPLVVPSRNKYLDKHDPWDRLSRKKIKATVFHNVIQNVDPNVTLNDTRARIPPDAIVDQKISMNYLARCNMKKSCAKIDVGSIYRKPTHKFSPHLYQAEYMDTCHNPVRFDHVELTGQKEKKPKYLWDENGSFPETPQAAGTGLFKFLEQRDMHRRHKHLEIKPFTVGSILSVTRTDQYSPNGPVKFVGICTEKNDEQETSKCTFTVRNVILEEPMEIIFYTYSPKVIKIEVLRHQVWENRETDLTCLRDWPHEYSTVPEDMKAEEYTEEPIVYKLTDEQKAGLKRHFDLDFERRRRFGAPYRSRDDWWPLGQYKTYWGARGRGAGTIKKFGYGYNG